tara:strand:- start:167 stop:1543 length:1377 start_codon:yes stop_codon:yes gene_type:complete
MPSLGLTHKIGNTNDIAIVEPRDYWAFDFDGNQHDAYVGAGTLQTHYRMKTFETGNYVGGGVIAGRNTQAIQGFHPVFNTDGNGNKGITWVYKFKPRFSWGVSTPQGTRNDGGQGKGYTGRSTNINTSTSFCLFHLENSAGNATGQQLTLEFSNSASSNKAKLHRMRVVWTTNTTSEEKFEFKSDWLSIGSAGNGADWVEKVLNSIDSGGNDYYNEEDQSWYQLIISTDANGGSAAGDIGMKMWINGLKFVDTTVTTVLGDSSAEGFWRMGFHAVNFNSTSSSLSPSTSGNTYSTMAYTRSIPMLFAEIAEFHFVDGNGDGRMLFDYEAPILYNQGKPRNHNKGPMKDNLTGWWRFGDGDDRENGKLYNHAKSAIRYNENGSGANEHQGTLHGAVQRGDSVKSSDFKEIGDLNTYYSYLGTGHTNEGPKTPYKRPGECWLQEFYWTGGAKITGLNPQT